MSTLNKLNIGDAGIIKRVIDSSMQRRLLDLGFIPGTKVKCVLISPFKDPKAYLINNNVYALRNIDASNIEVDYEEA